MSVFIFQKDHQPSNVTNLSRWRKNCLISIVLEFINRNKASQQERVAGQTSPDEDTPAARRSRLHVVKTD